MASANYLVQPAATSQVHIILVIGAFVLKRVEGEVDFCYFSCSYFGAFHESHARS